MYTRAFFLVAALCPSLLFGLQQQAVSVTGTRQQALETKRKMSYFEAASLFLESIKCATASSGTERDREMLRLASDEFRSLLRLLPGDQHDFILKSVTEIFESIKCADCGPCSRERGMLLEIAVFEFCTLTEMLPFNNVGVLFVRAITELRSDSLKDLAKYRLLVRCAVIVHYGNIDKIDLVIDHLKNDILLAQNDKCFLQKISWMLGYTLIKKRTIIENYADDRECKRLFDEATAYFLDACLIGKNQKITTCAQSVLCGGAVCFNDSLFE